MVSPKPNSSSPPRQSAEELVAGILRGDRILLSRAITLVESKLESDRIIADEVIQQILPATGRSTRIGITGIPGVGKSSFIETFGRHLTSAGKKIAVLAIDPSSQKTKGSILGDKTRMNELSRDENAFIRPTSAGAALGGVAENTREAILLCEAAGFDVVIVETVGVGQSEAIVREMVDFFLLLILGGAGDELQGIKKGIMEMADGLVVTKADGDNLKKARQAQADYQHALHLFPTPDSGWAPKVFITSALENKGMSEVWQMVVDYLEVAQSTGFLTNQRQSQNIQWFNSALEARLKDRMMALPSLRKRMSEFEQLVAEGKVAPGSASRRLVDEFLEVSSKS